MSKKVRWSADQDVRLRKLVAEGRSWSTIAERLKRTPGAVRARAVKLKIVGTKAESVQPKMLKPSERLWAMRDAVSADAGWPRIKERQSNAASAAPHSDEQ